MGVRRSSCRFLFVLLVLVVSDRPSLVNATIPNFLNPLNYISGFIGGGISANLNANKQMSGYQESISGSIGGSLSLGSEYRQSASVPVTGQHVSVANQPLYVDSVRQPSQSGRVVAVASPVHGSSITVYPTPRSLDYSRAGRWCPREYYDDGSVGMDNYCLDIIHNYEVDSW